MKRRPITFDCAGDTLAGTLDTADGASGLLLVSGGNEIRSGAFSGQARLAAQVAAQGFPVFRFDRRGVGDSEGTNRGFHESREDILAAIAAFRRECPQMQRVVAFGNCDAASALMLMQGDMCDALVLSNPWTFEDAEEDDDLPPAAAIRSRYAAKLRDPAELVRLLKGQVDIRKLAGGIKSILSKPVSPGSLAQDMANGLDAATKPYVILIAENDGTGQAFAKSWKGTNGPLLRCEGASHAYVEPHAQAWLTERVLDMLRG